jgi:hypothetical protein
MKYRLVTSLLVVGLVVATFAATSARTTHPARAAGSIFYVDSCPPGSVATKPPCDGDNVILRWDEQLLSAIRAYPRQTGPTIAARALGVLHTATYDAWAAYDTTAKVTRPDGPAQQVASKINEDNKKAAISYAAVRVLNDLFPLPPGGCPSPPTSPPTPFCPTSTYKAPNTLLGELGYSVNTALADPGDTTTPLHYSAKNQWNSVTNQWKWQPLCVLTAPAGVNAWNADHSLPLLTPPNCVAPNYTIQGALTPQWGNVTTFSDLGPAQFQFMAPGPPKGAGGVGYSNADVATALTDTDLSGADGDLKKAKAEYWADGPGSVFPPGHTAIFAQALSRKQTNSLDTDAKLFFMVGNAMMDASIASWWQKYKYDFWRPVTAIRYLYSGQQVKSWRGPGQGFQLVDGKDWMPYQALNVVTPAFPEYVSGHSTFTAAGASLLSLFNGSDTFGAGVKILAGSSAIEPGITPTADVMLSWATFSDASNEAGWSRRYGGIHFYTGDMHGRAIGRQVAQYVYSKAQSYIKGSIGK